MSPQDLPPIWPRRSGSHPTFGQEYGESHGFHDERLVFPLQETLLTELAGPARVQLVPLWRAEAAGGLGAARTSCPPPLPSPSPRRSEPLALPPKAGDSPLPPRPPRLLRGSRHSRAPRTHPTGGASVAGPQLTGAAGTGGAHSRCFTHSCGGFTCCPTHPPPFWAEEDPRLLQGPPCWPPGAPRNKAARLDVCRVSPLKTCWRLSPRPRERLRPRGRAHWASGVAGRRRG